jgi:hypothetical protein
LYGDAENNIATKEALEKAKAELFNSGKITATNDKARDAQTRELLADQFQAIAITERSERASRYAFEKASVDVDTVKTLLRIAELK